MATCIPKKIDSNVTSLRYAEEDCIGEFHDTTPAIAATGTITFDDAAQDGDTITIGTRVYTIVGALSSPSVADEILNGADAAATAANTRAALVAGAGAGTTYSTGTVANAQVGATVTGAVVALTALTSGAAGNSIATTTTGADIAMSGATLSGGADPVGQVPTWYELEPNSYSDFGGQNTLVARNPINRNRQRKKGSTVDYDASGGINQDLTYANTPRLMQGFMFADFRNKGTDTQADYVVTAGAGALSITTAGNFATLASSGLDFTTLGIIPGEWIYIGGDDDENRFDAEDNNGFKRVRSVSAAALVLDKSLNSMVDESGAGKQITLYLGRVLKNETGSLIKRRTYQLERTLGSLDGSDPPQSEYLIGAVPSEWVLNVGLAALLNVDLSFMALDTEERTQLEGLKSGNRPDLTEEDAFNSSNDVQRIRIAQVSSSEEAPNPLFTYASEATLTINNTLSPNKAIGVVGAFDVSTGTFAVSGSVTAYFESVEAIRAVRRNADVTMDIVVAKDGKGVVADLPLVALGDGRLNVVLDEPITIPLSSEAATGAKVDPNLNHTLLFTFFDYLPESVSL